MSTLPEKKKRHRKSPEQQAQALRDKLAQVEKKLRASRRSEDMHRKAILAGNLLAWAKNGDADARRILGKMVTKMEDRDRKALEPLDLAGEYGAKAGLSTPDQGTASSSAADQVMLELFKILFGPIGAVKVGDKVHWEALTALAGRRMTDEQRNIMAAHWQAKGWPLAQAVKKEPPAA